MTNEKENPLFSLQELSYAEKVLVLRFRILSLLREKGNLSPEFLSNAAICLNFVTDARELLHLEESVKDTTDDRELEAAFSSGLSRSIDPDSFFSKADRKKSKRQGELRHLRVPNKPCELKRRLQQALLLIDEGCTLLTLIDKKQILDKAAEVTCRLVSCDAAMSVLLEEEGKSLVGVCGSDNHTDHFPPKAQALLQPVETNSPMIVEDVSKLRGFPKLPKGHVPIKSFVSVPLRISNKPAGVILAGYSRKTGIDAGNVDMLRAFSKQVSFALENLSLHEQVRAMDRLRERQRIAQDLHDTVIQLLFAIGMEAEELMRSLPAESEEKEKALRIRRVASRAATELRSAIAALTIKPSYGETPLSELVQEAAEEVERMSNIQITIVEPPEWPEISPEASRAVYRVVREALTNVQKHSKATDAIVSVTTRPGKVIISVQDNGVGFPEGMNALVSGDMHFGLKAMHHLASQVGGYIEMLNGEDGGAVVRFVLPL